MALTVAHVNVEEYLGTMYHPDCDYVDGELEERNMGEWDHATFQALITSYFVIRRRQWNIHVATELRIRVAPHRYRIPDICVFLGPRPEEGVLTSPPFLCIEVLSPSDLRSRVQKRINDFLHFGVSYVWLVDPLSRCAWIYSGESGYEVDDCILRAGHIEVPLAELFD